jgi:hypothetical protein
LPKAEVGVMDKQAIGSDLRSAIEYYTELTIDEHLTGKLNKDADKTWNKIVNLINQLVEN